MEPAGAMRLMFDIVMKWLTGEPSRPGEPEDLQVAIVALLVQAARLDDRFDASERAAIERILASRFGLDGDGIRSLVETAARRAEDSTQILPFTRMVVEQLAPPERVQVIEMLYEVVLADGTLDPEEDALIRRIAGLIYVPDQERGAARKRARARLGMPV
jgi:uncharacterized tellurite resistance protein B-like protein